MQEYIKQIRVRFWHFRHAIKLLLVGSITKFECDENLAALTFDDGPHPAYTPRLLDVLAEFDAKATFFVTGDQAVEHPAIIQRIKDEGHALGCHSWDHPSFPLISAREQIVQISRWQAVAGTVESPRLFRPPFGNQSVLTNLLTKAMGYKTIMWNVIAQDWLDDGAAVILERLETQLSPGAILLMHDNLHDVVDHDYLDRTATIEAVRSLLNNHKEDYQFLSVTELLKRSKKVHRKLLFSMPNEEFLNSLHSTNTRRTT